MNRKQGDILNTKYINPYTDFGFKKLFGSPLNKDLLIGFLNALFEEAKQIPGDKILDVKYLSNEMLGRSPYDRKAVFDVLCETEKGVKKAKKSASKKAAPKARIKPPSPSPAHSKHQDSMQSSSPKTQASLSKKSTHYKI